MINEKKENNLENERFNQMKNLIEYILNLERKKINENENESPKVKLARRLEQRSYKKLSKEIIIYLIIRYELEYKKLPSKHELIQIMIDFLGNIQKSPKFYKLKSNIREIYLNIDEIIGTGSQGTIYSFNLKNRNQTKKSSKKLAVKIQNYGTPYSIDIHITSAILLAFYGFQPKYYNNNFMEIGNYPNKSQKREFHSINCNYYKNTTVKNNIKWFILYNLTNIADQTYNFMERQNGELTKIDIKHLNSETREINIENNLIYFNKYLEIFKQNKERIIKELNKIFNIKEDFIIDLIIFRTERGGFAISKKILSKAVKCLSSCFKIKKIKDETSFIHILNKSKKNFNGYHLEFNPALTWMLYILFQKNILNEEQYNECIDKFNEISGKYKKKAKIIEEKFINEILGHYKYDIKNFDKKHKKRSNTNDYKNKTKIIDKFNLDNFKKYDIDDILKEKKIIQFKQNSDCKLEKNNSKSSIISINDDKIEVDLSKEIKNKINNNIIDNIKKYDNIETQDENTTKNKKKKFSFGFCCGESAIDVND